MENADEHLGSEEREEKERREREEKRHELEKKLRAAEVTHRKALSAGIPILLVILVLEIVLVEVVFGHLWRTGRAGSSPVLALLSGYGWHAPDGGFWNLVTLSAFRFIPFWLLTLGVAASFYYFGLLASLRAATKELRDLKEEERLNRIADSDEELSDYVNRKMLSLSHEMAQTFLNNAKRYEEAREWRDEVLNLLNEAEKEQNRDKLVEAHALVSRIYELKAQEEGELREQAKWRRNATVILFIYIALIIAISFAFAGHSEEVPVFGVPVSVALWAAAGSLAAIGYRLYTEKERVQLDLEIRWLIARPVIGIIMGMLAYLAIRVGLLLLNATPSNDVEAVYWVVAFMAGFSDKFYIRIINLLTERTVGDGGQAPSEAEQAETAKPEPTLAEPERQDAEEQPDQPGDLDTGEGEHA